ncbi:MAG: hypothetical protein H0U59_09050, partial [Gemmatimonadaceae bacterium]|nr:hypothetical protein [Gemmatimonadaceae bacterium]
MIRRIFLIVLILSLCPTLTLAADVNPPVRFGATKADRTKIAGQITAIDEGAFTYTDARGQSQQVKWDEMDAANTLGVYEKVIGKGDAQTWLSLGKRLREMKNGKVPGDRALARALRLDPKLKEEIDKIKKGEAGASTQPGASTRPGASGRAGGAGATDKGPRIEENPKLAEWPKLTDVEQLEAV